MMDVDCAAVEERAAELALGVLSGPERAAVVEHLASCAQCRSVVGELAEVADLLPGLAPEAAPPAGFEDRVLGAMRGDRRRAFRRRVMAVGAAAAAAAILSVVAVRVIDANRSGQTQASPALHSVAMVGWGGETVGRLVVAGESHQSLAVSVDYSVPDGAYSLIMNGSSGASHSLGTITVAQGQGDWSGTAELSKRDTVTVSMVDQAGAVVCKASLAPSVT
jgi:predicted anti-sigma-YlaC factor YlaD